MKYKILFETFLTSRLYKDLFLISLGLIVLAACSIFIIMRYRELSTWEHLKHAHTAEEIKTMLQTNDSEKFREIAMMKLSELFMGEKKI